MEKLKELFTRLGFADADATALVDGLNADEPTLDVDAVLTQAQAYAKPLLEGDISKGADTAAVGRVVGELYSAIAQESGGKISRKDLEGMSRKDAIKKFKEVMSVTADNTELNEMIDRLNTELSAKDTDWQTKYNALEQSHNAEKVHTTNGEALAKMLAPKDTVLEKSALLSIVHRDMQDKYHMVYNSQTNDFDLYDKNDHTQRVKTATGNGFLKGSEEVNNLVLKYGGEKKSNGSGSATTHKQTPPPNQRSGARKSSLSQKYEAAGHTEE